MNSGSGHSQETFRSFRSPCLHHKLSFQCLLLLPYRNSSPPFPCVSSCVLPFPFQRHNTSKMHFMYVIFLSFYLLFAWLKLYEESYYSLWCLQKRYRQIKWQWIISTCMEECGQAKAAQSWSPCLQAPLLPGCEFRLKGTQERVFKSTRHLMLFSVAIHMRHTYPRRQKIFHCKHLNHSATVDTQHVLQRNILSHLSQVLHLPLQI